MRMAERCPGSSLPDVLRRMRATRLPTVWPYHKYPGTLQDGYARVRALAERFAPYATGLRDAMARAAEVEDAGSVALYTDLSHGIDQQFGILDAHLHR